MLVCIDLETTGFDPNFDEVIEVALVKFDEKSGEILETFSSLVSPKKNIPSLIQALTSIEDSMLDGAPEISQLANKIQDFIGNNPIVGHNVRFDISFLQVKGIPVGKNQIVDTFFLANFLYYQSPSLSLESLAKSFSISQESAHRALDDVLATIQLFLHIKKDISALSKIKKQLLRTLLTFSIEKNVTFLSDVLELTEVDILSFEAFQELILQNLSKFPPLDSFEKQEDTETYSQILSHYGEYSFRKGQESLFSLFQETLGKQEKYVIEAPTGVGKTFAYLIPALKFALKSGKQVIISTKTKMLQDQITSLDRERISKILGEECKITKLKGKKNYLSLQNFFSFLDQNRQLSLEDFSFFAKICFWLIETEFGELDELNIYGNESTLVDNVNVQSNEVLSPKNPFLDDEFYKKVIERIPFSHIVVVNHHFVFSDIMKPQGSLLKYEHIIFDEAHNLEDIGTESLKASYNRQSFSSYLQHYELSSQENSIVEDILFLFEDLEEIFSSLFRIQKPLHFSEKKTELIPQDTSLEEIYQTLGQLSIQLKSLKQVLLKSHKGEFDDGDYVDSLIQLFESFTLPTERQRKILYYTYDEKNKLSIFSTYRHIGNFLKENIWQKAPNIYLLSATFSVDGDISFIRQSLSLENFSFFEIPSHFDYQNQAFLYIPTNLGDIKKNSEQIVNFLSKLISIVQGQTMVLFTSLLAVKQVYIGVHEALKLDENIQILAQGVHGGKTKILETFKAEGESTVVFGTESFWEGVDIPGKNLSYLVIHKLPFPVPTDPIFIARSSQYKNSFQEYAIPKAILKLKQGFGRLIRTETDTGVILLLDNRIIQTDWGKRFFSAFPKNISFDILSDTKILESIAMRK